MNTKELITGVNQYRESKGLEALAIDRELTASAQTRAEQLCNGSEWSHDGWKDTVTYQYSKAGESLAKNYDDSQSTVDAWIASQKHEQNMVGQYKDTGMAVMTCGDDTYAVQHFGMPPASPEWGLIGIVVVVAVVVGSILYAKLKS